MPKTRRSGRDHGTRRHRAFNYGWDNIKKSANWTNKLQIACNRRDLGAVLLILDGDAEKVEGADFCAMKIAALLAERAKTVGAGTVFSLACVFACQEYESILIAGAELLAGRELPDGRPGVKTGTLPPQNLDNSPRDAKGWLHRNMKAGYRPTRDQKLLTEMLDINAVRNHGLRSFRRLESALLEITSAVRTGAHISSPILR